MSKRYSGKSFKDSSVKKKPKLTIKEKQAVELEENKINESLNQDKVEKKTKKVVAVVKLIFSLFFLF